MCFYRHKRLVNQGALLLQGYGQHVSICTLDSTFNNKKHCCDCCGWARASIACRWRAIIVLEQFHWPIELSRYVYSILTPLSLFTISRIAFSLVLILQPPTYSSMSSQDPSRDLTSPALHLLHPSTSCSPFSCQHVSTETLQGLIDYTFPSICAHATLLHLIIVSCMMIIFI